MPQFRYIARDTGGTRSEGTLQARDAPTAARALRDRGLTPVSVDSAREAPARWASRLPSYLRPLPRPRLAQLFTQLAALLRSGVTPHESMRELAHALSDRRLARMAREIGPRLAHGAALADQLARYPALIPGYAVETVRAGERLGALPDVLASLAAQFETEAEIAARLRWLKVYYGAVLVLAVLVAPFPLMVARGMRWYLHLAATTLLPGLLGALALAWLLRGVANLPALRGLRARVLAALPVVGALARWSMLSRMLETLAVSQRAGVTLDEGLELAGAAAGHPALRRGAQRAAMRIRHGRSLAEALAQMNALPRPIRDMLAAAERSGSVEASTATAAEHAAQERDAAADTVVAGSAAGALALGAVITLIALAIAWRNLYEAIFERAGV